MQFRSSTCTFFGLSTARWCGLYRNSCCCPSCLSPRCSEQPRGRLMKQQQQQKTNDVLNSCARCCSQEEQWTPQALPVGGNRSRSTLSAPSGPFQTKSNTAHIASALPQMHRSDKRANFGSCKIKKWTSRRVPRRFFLSSLPLLSPATKAVLGSYMSSFYS